MILDCAATVAVVRRHGRCSIMGRFFSSRIKGRKDPHAHGQTGHDHVHPHHQDRAGVERRGKISVHQALVILTNGGSASAFWKLFRWIAGRGRALVVGERSCRLPVRLHRLCRPTGRRSIGLQRVGIRVRQGKRIEGEGVVPDKEVTLTAEDYRLNRDRVLEAAEAFWGRRSRRSG